MFWMETGLVLVSLLVAFTFPSLGSKWFERLEQCLARLARRRTLSVLLIGLSALILRAALLPVFPVPQPVVHDEFGYLLAADTYAHGRLTTPTHPMWVHFETFSILQKPTYQCYAQPAQGMVLAFGERVFGHPFWGVWLSAGLMCATIAWMLQGWLPPEWALLGGTLAVLRYGVITYWGNSYWGGAAGAIGGALVIGALPRIKSSPRVRDALLMGLGLGILANSRPYEGFVFSLPVAVALFASMLGKHRPRFEVALGRVVLPLALTLTLTAAGLGYYFWRLTGSPVRMPYQIERMQNGIAPLMIWQHLRPEPTYHHAIIKKMYVDEELPAYKLMSSPAGTAIKGFWGWRFYLGPLLTFPALMMILVLPYGFGWKHITTETRFLILTLGVFTIGLMLEPFYSPHYSSPATAIVLALVVKAIRYLSDWRVGLKPSGLFLARAIPVIAVFMFVLRAAAGPLHIPVDHAVSPAWNEQGPRNFGRSIVEAHLASMPGQQLVIVRYKPTHEPFEEWVYNAADIDNSKVVWAREMDGADDRQLIQYFKSRQVWLLEADEKPPRLTPYTTSGSAEMGR